MSSQAFTSSSERSRDVTMTTFAPLGACYDASLSRNCDRCAMRGRTCDGFGIKACSFCVATKQPICHYSSEETQPRRSPRILHSSRETRRQLLRAGGEASEGGGTQPTRRTRRRPLRRQSPTGPISGAPDAPLKRSRLSVSPATGLIGLPENRLLNDFFVCLGFLSLASQSDICGAVVSVMLAADEQQEPVAGTSSPPPSPLACHAVDDGGEEGGGSEVGAVENSADGRVVWNKAVSLPAGDGARRRRRGLPRDYSTCLLWCAIALGAFFRGCPLPHVGQYVDLAEDSLTACADGCSVDDARTYVAMAYLHSLLGNQGKSLECMQGFEGVVASLGEVPTALSELAAYVGLTSGFQPSRCEQDLRVTATAQEPAWDEDAASRQLPGVLTRESVCSFFIGSKDRANNSLASVSGATLRQYLTAEAAAGRLNAAPPSPDGGARSDGAGARVSYRETGAWMTPVEQKAGVAPPCSDEASSWILEKKLPEMVRLQAYFDSTAETRAGIGAIMYYSILGIVQTVAHDHAAAAESMRRVVDLVLPFPGCLRSKRWSHVTHAHLRTLASGPDKETYEQFRAAFNSVQPPGSLSAPPYAEWRGMFDICDHPGAFCRELDTRPAATSPSKRTA